MNDPWDVKSVRQGHQYQSCMRLNGVPLLPPVLSKECRKEMQYYKLLAREVEKRIAILRSYVGNDTDSSEDKTDAPELPECEHEEYLSSPSKLETSFIFDNNNIVAVTEDLSPKSNTFTPLSNKLNPKFQSVQDSMLHENFELEVDQELYEVSRTPHRTLEPNELPERDCDFTSQPRKEKEVLTEVETGRKKVQKELIDDLINFDFHLSSHNDEFIPLHQDGPSSLSSKSFTGSLLDLHSESAKDAPKLIRQRSYTVLKPSPQLLAHLEVQSISTGVDVSSISMSESMSNLSLPNKKRRSWDLESAKVKWSSMAMELKKSKIVTKTSTSGVAKTSRKSHVSPLAKSQSQIQEKSRKFINSKLNKSEPVQKQKAIQSPVRNVPSDRTIVKEPAGNKTIVKKTPPKIANSKKEEVPLKESPNTLISSSEDPAAQVRELYEKLQKQQLVQMASLVEKQKREQQLLQQVFEEQNTVLLKQLKTVCPKSSIEMKQAWGDLKDDAERGPVSLSQLINNKTPEHSVPNSPVSKTLTETNNYINKCDNVLRKSRDLTDSIKKLQPKPRSNVKKSESPIQTQPEGNRTRTHSPTSRNTSRRLNYDTSTTSDYENMASPRDYDQMLTDRTNDTMADLNVTFPSDSDECSNFTKVECRKVTTVRACSPVPRSYNGVHSTDTALKNLEYSIQNSMNAMSGRLSPKQNMFRPPTTRERVAATKIVAFAKGYLVRRLMRTERVQATVQTIRDALLCALQLHQDRAGIRGADVDLHRRLIQQITAACYSLHDTFVASSPGERCALLAADRARSQALAARRDVAPHRPTRRTDIMSQSHSGAFPVRSRPAPASFMTQSNYGITGRAKEILDNATLFSLDPLPLVSYLEYPDPETFNADKVRPRYMPSPRRRPWR